jgi:hypothetical protein
MRFPFGIPAIVLAITCTQAVADDTKSPPQNEDVSITMTSGETIGPFRVSAQFGYRHFHAAYQLFLKNGTQTEYLFRMFPNPPGSSPEVHIIVDFENIAAISTVESSSVEATPQD